MGSRIEMVFVTTMYLKTDQKNHYFLNLAICYVFYFSSIKYNVELYIQEEYPHVLSF